MRTLTVSTLIALSSVLWAGSVSSQELPQVPEGGLLHYKVSDCTDNESGQSGRWYMFDRGDGTFYMVFTQQGEPVFVRQTLKEGGYITVWRFGEVEA